jgi:Ca-activated chloride channel family protein
MDVEPNRLRRAKIEIYEFLEKAKDHRIGITVFSARPHLFVPLTFDHVVLKKYLESLDKLSFPTMGSDPVAAIAFAQKELNKSKGKSAIILLTDGDFKSTENVQIEELRTAKIPLYVLGVGTVEGEAVQLADGSWLKHKQQHVVSKMNEDNLRQLASQLNGKYSPVYDDNEDWKTLYEQGVARLNLLTNSDTEQRIAWRELFPWFLFPSLFLFWFSLRTKQFKYYKNITLFTFISSLMIFTPEKNANAFELGETIEQSAYRAYHKKNYSKAVELYQNVAGDRVYHGYLGRANSLYKMGHYQKAIQQYTVAILNSQNDTQRANALYNLANSYFRTGDFNSAIRTYKDVLRYQAENKASLHNINISQTLQKNIEQRLKEKEKIIASMRQGRGPRSENIADGTDIGENTSVSIGGNENTLSENIPLPKLPDINEDIVKQLILSGLENIKLAELGYEEQTLKHDVNKNINLTKAQQQLKLINDSQHILWKRLFEIEEGFPAPVESPRKLPGVKPW